MKKQAMAALVLAGVLALSTLAMAQEGQGRGRADGGTRQAARLDTDGDGRISASEWRGRKEAFDRLDANNDGYIDNTERQGARNQATQGARNQARQRDGQRGAQAGQGPAAGQGTRRGRMAPQGAGQQGRQGGRMQEAAAPAGALFRLIDADNDGRLSTAEIRAFARRVGAADADNDGYVTREEAHETFRERVRESADDHTGEDAGEAFFQRNDTNGDGIVTADEWGGRPERFEQLDLNDDGVITSADMQERHNLREEAQQSGRAQDGGRGQGGGGQRSGQRGQGAGARGRDAQ